MSLDTEISDSLVLSWFPESKFGEPRVEPVRRFCAALTLYQRVRSHNELAQFQEDLASISKAARALIKDLEAFQHAAGKLLDLRDVIEPAVAELAPFSNLPPRSRGRDSEWIDCAVAWAPLVANCFADPGEDVPSISTDGGPVSQVLVQAMLHVHGLTKDPADIARRVRERAKPDLHPEVAEFRRRRAILDHSPPKRGDIK